MNPLQGELFDEKLKKNGRRDNMSCFIVSPMPNHFLKQSVSLLNGPLGTNLSLLDQIAVIFAQKYVKNDRHVTNKTWML